MMEVMPHLLEKAKLKAKEIKDQGEVLGSVPFGKTGENTYVVSSDRHQVFYYAIFDVEGMTFYFGDRKQTIVGGKH